MFEHHDLSGKTAIVTGASSGIGRAIAEHLGASGAHVILSGRTTDAMEHSAALITERGGRATAWSATSAIRRRFRRWSARQWTLTGTLTSS